MTTKENSYPIQNEVQGLEMYKMEQAARIQSLLEDNSQLKRTIKNGGLTTPPPTLYPASLQVWREEKAEYSQYRMLLRNGQNSHASRMVSGFANTVSCFYAAAAAGLCMIGGMDGNETRGSAYTK